MGGSISNLKPIRNSPLVLCLPSLLVEQPLPHLVRFQGSWEIFEPNWAPPLVCRTRLISSSYVKRWLQLRLSLSCPPPQRPSWPESLTCWLVIQLEQKGEGRVWERKGFDFFFFIYSRFSCSVSSEARSSTEFDGYGRVGAEILLRVLPKQRLRKKREAESEENCR